MVSAAQVGTRPTPVHAQATGPSTPVHRVDWGFGGVGLLRYNRAEGLFASISGERSVGALSLHGLVGWAMTDAVPQLSVGTLWRGPRFRVRSDLFHGIQAVNADVNPLGMFNSIAALLAGLDEGEYYRATGARLRFEDAARDRWSLALYFERQAGPKSAVAFSVLGWPFPSLRGRPLAPVEPLRQVGLRGRVQGRWGGALYGPSATAAVAGRVETGGARMAAVTATGSVELPLGQRARVAVESGVRGSGGRVPSQRLALVGGPSRVRGFDGATARGREAAWTRMDVLVRVHTLTPVVFGDLGWAGDRSDPAVSMTLASAGVGFSFLDDTIRVHAARRLRGGRAWRLDVYADALR